MNLLLVFAGAALAILGGQVLASWSMKRDLESATAGLDDGGEGTFETRWLTGGARVALLFTARPLVVALDSHGVLSLRVGAALLHPFVLARRRALPRILGPTRWRVVRGDLVGYAAEEAARGSLRRLLPSPVLVGFLDGLSEEAAWLRVEATEKEVVVVFGRRSGRRLLREGRLEAALCRSLELAEWIGQEQARLEDAARVDPEPRHRRPPPGA